MAEGAMEDSVRPVQREDSAAEHNKGTMSFSEYCQALWGYEMPDWQKDILDQYYDAYKSRGIDSVINVSRGYGKTNTALWILESLSGYLDYLEGKDAHG